MQQAVADLMPIACGIVEGCLRRRYFCQYESWDWVKTLLLVRHGG
jgi:hypothetical protein